MPRFMEPKAPIKNRDDLLDYIYWQVGVLSMEEVRALVDLVLKYGSLTEESKY